MSLTVAFDTATDVASIAIGDGREVWAELTVPGRRHAAVLLPSIMALLGTVGARLADVTRVLCADGPGSFTGLRIGFATAQGIVRAGGDVSVGTSPSLMLMAWAAAPWSNGPVAVMYDALRGEGFGALYRFTPDRVDALVAPRLSSLAQFRAECPARPGLVVGDPGVLDAEVVAQWIGRAPVVAPHAGPRAAALISLDGVDGGVRRVADVITFEPDYGRPAEAQVRWEAAHGRRMPDSGGAFR
jgi:tRNA threonylcarbamoyladenosine biosynthesis protein TsaB